MHDGNGIPPGQIVHVDDDVDILAVLKVALEALGSYCVTSFSSGAEALENLGVISPDLIILDLSMPGMDGREVIRKITQDQALGDTPVVFLTAQKSEATTRELLELGAVAVLPKPFDPFSFHHEITSILESSPHRVSAHS